MVQDRVNLNFAPQPLELRIFRQVGAILFQPDRVVDRAIAPFLIFCSRMVDARRVAVNPEILKYQARIQKALNIGVCVKNDSESGDVSPLVLNIFGVEFSNLFESSSQAFRRFGSMLNGLRSGELARLDRLFQNDLHGLSEFLIPGIELAFVIVESHANLKTPPRALLNSRRSRLHSSACPGPPLRQRL